MEQFGTVEKMKEVAAAAPSRRNRLLFVVAGLVLAWFAVAEVASQFWYFTHESKLPKNPVPVSGAEILRRARQFADENGSQLSERDIGSTATEMLKCSYGKTLAWFNPRGAMSALTVLKWDERSVVGGVESMHNPGNCLGAAGWTIGARTALGVENFCGVTCEVVKWDVSQSGFNMQAYSAVFRRYSETEALSEGAQFWNNGRLRSVLSGRRDAPVLILLAYLPAGNDSKAVDENFRQIMRSILCRPNS